MIRGSYTANAITPSLVIKKGLVCEGEAVEVTCEGWSVVKTGSCSSDGLLTGTPLICEDDEEEEEEDEDEETGGF